MRKQTRDAVKYRTWWTVLVAMLLWGSPAWLQAQFSYTVTNGTVTITKYVGPAGSVVVPETIEGLPVTSLAGTYFYLSSWPLLLQWVSDGAFFYSGVTDVLIPNTVTNIGVGAFGFCSALTNILIPDSVQTIGDDAFYRCNLATVTLGPNLKSIGSGAFADSGLTSVVR